MNSDQFSDKPPPGKKRCPHCGELMSASAEMCWLCREKFSVQAGEAPYHSSASGAALAHGRPGAGMGDNVAWLFVGGLVILICGVLAFEAPGVLLILVILATPA